MDLSNRDKYEYVIENKVHRLVVKRCDDSDSGQYEIFLKNPDDFDISSKAKLIVEKGTRLISKMCLSF